MAEIADFTSLVTSEHQDRPKFVATISASVGAFVDQINLAVSAGGYYDLDEAVGAQLDAVGLWVGISRYVALDIEQYFSWDTLGLGWDQGIWFQIGDALTQVTTLGDSDYRQVIRAKILCNQWDGSLPEAVKIVSTAIGYSAEYVKIFEAKKSVSFSITAEISRVMQSVLMGGYLPIKPAGVSASFFFLPAAVVDNDFMGDIT